MGTETVSLKKNVVWNTLGNFIYLFSQWLITIVIVRVTSYREAGIYSLAVSITNVLYSVALYGIRNFQVSDIKNSYTDKEYIINRYITCAISFVICIFVLLINPYSKEQQVVIVLYMIFHIEEAYVDVLHGVAQKRGRLDVVGVSCLVRGILNLIIFTTTLIVTSNLSLSILSMMLMTAIVLKSYDERIIQHFPQYDTNYSKKKIMQLLGEGISLVGYTVLIAATPVIPRYYLENIYGQEILGIYATIATPTVIIQAAIGYLLAPIIVPLSEMYEKNDKKGFCHMIKVLVLIMLAIFVFCILGGTIFGDFGLKILFGEEILKYSYVLVPVIICTIETAIALFINAVLIIFRKLKSVLFINTVGTVVSCIISHKIVSLYGLNGTSYAHMISMGIQIFLGVALIAIIIKIKFTDKYKK